MGRSVDGRQEDNIEVQHSLALDGEGSAYVATYRVDDGSAPLASITLPREVVEAAVLSNANIGLELRTDGSLVAFAGCPSMQTLASMSLHELITETLRPDLIALEDTPIALINLESELERALASVKEFRVQRGGK